VYSVGTGSDARGLASLKQRFPDSFFEDSFPVDNLNGKRFSTVVLEIDFSRDPFGLIHQVCDLSKDLGEPFLFFYSHKSSHPSNASETWENSIARLESTLLQKGYRKHPMMQSVAPYDFLDDQERYICVVEKIPDSGSELCLLEDLYTVRQGEMIDGFKLPEGLKVRQRDLHMDMLREFGHRSDAHIARYSFAANRIRPNDIVVDAGCGLGYGAYILSSGSYCEKVYGFDLSEFAVTYAQANYQSENGPEFLLRDSVDGDLSLLPPVDLVVAFEIIEHLKNPAKALKRFYDLLKPGGRVVLSVPNMWVDETGKDPWFFHEDAYDLDKILGLCKDSFLIEKVFAQRAGGKGNRFGETRCFSEFIEGSSELNPKNVEWWVVVLMKSPLEEHFPDYEETVFPVIRHLDGKYHSYKESYRNPWVLHSMVHGSIRMDNTHVLAGMLDALKRMSSAGSADYGAALCVEAYQAIDASWSQKRLIIAQIEDFFHAEVSTPHAFRWHVSLMFVKGVLAMTSGYLELAADTFNEVSYLEADLFSPHLMTKAAEAAFLSGKMQLSLGKKDEAARCWRRGLQIGRSLSACSWEDIIISEQYPNRFGFGDGLREYLVALDSVIRCANGIYWINHGKDRSFHMQGIEDSFEKIERRERITRGLLALEGAQKTKNFNWAIVAEEDKKRLEKVVNKLQGELSEEIDKLNNLLLLKNRLESSVENYKAELAGANAKSDDLLLLNEQLESSVEHFKAKLAEVNAEKQAVSKNLNSALSELSDVKRQLSDVRESLVVVREECDSLEMAARRLRHENENYREVLDNKSQIIEEQLNDLTRTRNEVSEALYMKDVLAGITSEKNNGFRSIQERQNRIAEFDIEGRRYRYRRGTALGRFLTMGNAIVRVLRVVYCALKFGRKKSDSLSVVQVNTHDLIGGAERTSYDLHLRYRVKEGVDAYLVVGGKQGSDEDVIKLEYTEKDWEWAETWRDEWGLTEAFYPTPIWASLRLSQFRNADIVHIHNMHGKYWSSSALMVLVNRCPVVLTLHDEYAMTGDCCYTYDCERWKKSCGNCPQVGLAKKARYTLAGVDRTRINVRIKRAIFRAPKAYPMVVVTPTKWMSSRARRSRNLRHLPIATIPNGIDLNFWKPLDQLNSRKELHLPGEGIIALVVASDLTDRRKGFDVVLETIIKYGESSGICFVVLGGVDADVVNECAEKGYPLHFRGYIKDKDLMRKYYSAVDFTISMSLEDNLPYMCVESLACGRPVLGSDAGGIPEIVSDPYLGWLLPRPISPGSLNNALDRVKHDFQSGIKQTMFEQCREAACLKYDIKLMEERYLSLYKNMIARKQPFWEDMK